MNLKALSFTVSLLGIPQASTSEEVDRTRYTIGNAVAGVYIAHMASDCYINTNGDDTIIHCREEESLLDFISANHISQETTYTRSLLKIQGTTAITVILALTSYPEKVGGILELRPPYDMSVYPNGLRVCLEINNPSINDTVGGIMIDINGDNEFDGIATGECLDMDQKGDFNVNLDTVIFPGYSVTLPHTSYDCAGNGRLYNCRDSVEFPFVSSDSIPGRDVVQIQDPTHPELGEAILDLSKTYLVTMHKL